jgi:O-antigen ligase
VATSKKKRAAAAAKAPVRPAAGNKAMSLSADVVRAGMDVYDKVIWFCLHALVILVPIAMSNLTWLGIGNGVPLTYDQFDIVKVVTMRALTLIALAAWSWKMLMNGGKLRRTKVDWFILAFLAWVALTTVFSISPMTALFGKYRRFEGFLSFLTYAVIFFLAVQVVDRPSRVRSLLRSLFFGGVLVSMYGIIQYIGADPIKWGTLPFEVNRSFSTFGNPDLLGGYLMFPLPISLGLALTEEDAWWRAIYWAGFFLIAVDWITAFVRGAWIGGFVGLAVLVAGAVYFVRKQDVKLHSTVDAGAGGLTLLALIAVIVRSATSGSGVMNFVERLQSITQFGQGSARTRFEIWEAAWGAIKARPIFGWGADTFRLVFPMFKPASYTRDAGYLSVADNVHDYPLQLASGIGIPGFLLLYAGIIGLVLVLSMITIIKKATGPMRFLMLAVWAACIGYVLHLMTGLSVTGSTFLLWLCFAVLMSPTATSVDVKAPAWGTIAAAVGLAIIAGASIYNVVYAVADNHYLKARVNSDGTTRVAEVKAALALDPWNDMYLAELGLAYQDVMSGLLQQTPQSATAVQEAQKDYELAVEAFKTTIKFVPTEYDNYVFLTNLYNQGRQYDNAIALGTEAMNKVEPFGPAIRLQVAMAYLGKGDNNNAIKLLTEAANMDPAYSEPRIMLGDTYKSLKDLKDAAYWYQQVVTNATSDSQRLQGQQALAGIGVTATTSGP